MTHHIDARYDENDGTFIPPLRTLGFNPQLKLNDSLLVQSYIEAYDLSYPEALRRIEGEVAELRQHLETNGYYELYDLGVLRLNSEGNLVFEPCEAGILTPTLYGLSSFQMKPLTVEEPVAEESPEEVQAVVEEADDTAITIRMSWLRNAVAVAAAVIAFLMIGKPISNSVVQHSAFIPISAPASEQVTTPEAQLVSETVATEAAVANTADMKEVTEVPVSATSYCLVLASQVSKRNADNFVTTLQNAGFADAKVTEGSMIRVVYGTYASESEAYNALQSLRSKSRHFREAWVMKVSQ